MAEENSQDKTIVESEICNCTICLEVFKSPKYLPCLHTYCESCLHDYILSTTSDGKSAEGVFFCPVCRTEVHSPDPSVPKEQWAKLMPANYMINSLMEISSGSCKKTEKDKQECDLCKMDGETTEAEFWCFECREYLCATCTKHHRRSKASRNHNPVPVNDTSPGQVAVAKNQIEEPCSVHKDEVLKVYCIDHQKMCCVLCLSIDHRKCENIKTFDEMAEKMKQDNEAQMVADKLEKMASKVEQACDRKMENIKSIEKEHQDIQEKTDNLVEEAKNKLEKCRQEFTDNFQGIHKEQVAHLRDIEEKLQNFQKSFTNSHKMLTASAEYSTPKQAFITLEKIKERLVIQGNDLEALLKDDHQISYDVTLNEELVSMTANISSVADIQLKKTVYNVPSLSPAESEISLDTTEEFNDSSSSVQVESLCVAELSPAVSGISLDSTDVRDTTINAQMETLCVAENFPLQMQLKKTCINDIEPVHIWNVSEGGKYTGGTFLLDGRLLLINCALEAMMVYDVNGKKEIFFQLPFTPWGAVQHSDGSIFVSSRSSGCVVVYIHVNDTFQHLKNIDIADVDCLNAISVTPDYILTERSQIIRAVTTDGREVDKYVCSVHSPIATSSTQGKPIFYHCQGNDVVCRKVSGGEIFRYKLQETASARGIGLDCAGNIYVTDNELKNIFVISHDGRSGQIFMSSFENVVAPYALGFDRTGTKFFITDMENGSAAVYNLNVKT